MNRRRAFTLVEVMTALAILALVCSSVWVIIDRCMMAAADSALRMAAFETVRDNMEKVLASSSVKETVDYGRSERYPGITCQTVVETFSEPMAGKLWVRAVCSAEYSDTAGQPQTLELTSWLTELTEQQTQQVAKDKQQQEAELAAQVLDTTDDAAAYAGVDANTIEDWVKDGLVKAEDGSFIKRNLDLFAKAQGKPSSQDKARQVRSISELADQVKRAAAAGILGAVGTTGPAESEIDSVTGLTYQQIEKMTFEQVMDLLMKRRQK